MELYNKPNQVEPVQVIFTHLLRERADKAEAESARLKAESASLKDALCSKFADLPLCTTLSGD